MPVPLNIWLPDLLEHRKGLRVLFRVDAGRLPGLSFGHLFRCALVASVLTETLGAKSIFLMRTDCPETVQGAGVAKEMGLTVMSLQGCENESVMAIFSGMDAHWLITDLPYQDQDTGYFSQLRKVGGRVLFIDDDRYLIPEADVILNSSVKARDRYSGDIRSKLMLGLDYFIFREAGSEAVLWGVGLPRVLLTFGGSDPSGLTFLTLEALTELKGRISLLAVLGPGFSDTERAKLTASAADAEVIHAPGDIEAYFKGADLVVCAGGRTMYELHALGIDFFPIGSAPHEADAVTAVLECGFVPSGLPVWNRERFLVLLKQRTGIL